MQYEWAFGLSEYQKMFDLTQDELNRKLLDFPAGLSGVNAEISSQGGFVISGDSNYDLSSQSMKSHASQMLEKLRQHLIAHEHLLQDKTYTLDTFLERSCLCASRFLKDYAEDATKARYQNMNWSQLPFSDHHFDLALCSYWLFSEHPDSFFQIQAIKELLRVAVELRIYPLLNRDSQMPASLGPVMLALQRENFGVELREVDFSLKKEGNAMLRIWALECSI